MRYVSIDIETTGLDPETHQVLEIGAVADDLQKPFPKDPAIFQCYVRHESTVGSAGTLAMNADILKIIAGGKTDWGPILSPDRVALQFQQWLVSKAGYRDEEKVIFAGKNVGSFDLQFLKKLNSWNYIIPTHYKTIDPTPLYMMYDDHEPPSMNLCAQRAGIVDNVKHRAVDDALMIIRLLRLGKPL